MSLGVTIGKFYPFHLGHAHLIREAKGQVDRLVVIVGEHAGQELSGALRLSWIQEVHPDVELLLATEDIPETPEAWGARTLELLAGRRPDVAFTSEDYGEAWAAVMGCRHEAIDPPRERFPVSGSALRADLGAGWDQLTPPARAHFARRVVVVGVESSGTTTLARQLAEHLETTWVPEYGRHYWEGRRHLPDAERWSQADFERIARTQLASEEDLARRARRVLVCDTDPLATAVWERRYLGPTHPLRLELLAEAPPRALYLLTAPDFEFVQDGTRESEPLRADMHAWFEEALASQGAPWALVSGSPVERLAQALERIEPLLSFAPLADP